MKHKSYKKLLFLFLAGIISIVQAQKFDKKFTENFTTNKDVEISIDASNTDIDVRTWNKNQVSVEAFIEVEGLSKKEAEKYFKNWNFEALGNKKKVKITSKRNNLFHSNNDFIFFNDNWVMPEINIPDVEGIAENVFILPNDHYYKMFSGLDSINDKNIFIDIDSLDFDSEKVFIGLENLDFDFDKYMEDGKEYFFQWKDDANNITIKSKKEWEAFKKTKKYKELKEKMKKSREKMKKQFAISRKKLHKIDKQKIRKELKKAKHTWEKVDKVIIKKDLAKARKELKKMKFNYFFDSDSEDIMMNGKKVKIKKRLVIKVPKKATFDLNTRHCKVKLPNTKASGKVSYGTFDANNLNGGKLNISYSPVTINGLHTYNLSLNNVTDAKIASVTNTNMFNNSSGVRIVKVNENVDLSSKFGELLISNINPDYQSFKLMLDYTEATVHLSEIPNNLVYAIGNKPSLFSDTPSVKFNGLNSKSKDMNGNFIVKTKDNTLHIQGKYSQLTVKK
ncbi:MAG: hypothetical protein ACPGTO_01145 [Polaribacter sp.]